MKLPKLPNILKGKKSRPSSLARSSPSSSSRSSSSASSGEASPPLPGTVASSGEVKLVSGQGSSVITRHSPALQLEHQELSNAFKLIDVNEDGKISPSELASVLSSLGHTSSEEELRVILELVDTDGDGFIDLQEFISHSTKMDKVGSTSPARTKELRQAFNVFDIDRNNFISAEELHQVLKGLGEKSTMDDCSRMICGVDSDGDGQVNFEEFERMMRSTLVY